MEDWQKDLVQALLERLQALELISEPVRCQALARVHAASDFPAFIRGPGGEEEA